MDRKNNITKKINKRFHLLLSFKLREFTRENTTVTTQVGVDTTLGGSAKGV